MWGLTFSLLLGIIDHDQHTRTHGIVSTSNASDHTAACDDAAAAEVHPSGPQGVRAGRSRQVTQRDLFFDP